MKKIISLLFLIPAAIFAAAGDIKIERKNSSDNAWIATIFAKQNGGILGTDSSGVPGFLDGISYVAGTTAGQLIHPVGAVGTPSVTFLGDTDNGLYYVGTNSFGVSVGGVNLITYSAGQSQITGTGVVRFGATAGATIGVSADTADGILTFTAPSAGGMTAPGASFASIPAMRYTGSWFTGGSSTTTKPHILIEPSGTTSTAWNTGGTGLGINAASGFSGLFVDFQLAGVSRLSVSNLGVLSGVVGTTNIPWTLSQGATGRIDFTANSSSANFRINALSVTIAGGNTSLDGALITTPQALSGAGAVNVTTSATFYTSTGGAQALTLANGTAGQIKTIVHQVDGGSGVLTPTTKIGFTTITFTNVGDSCTLQYTAAGWVIVGIFGAVAA